MGFSDRLLVLLACGCLAIAQEFRVSRRPADPVAPSRSPSEDPQRRPWQFAPKHPNPTPVQRPPRFQERKHNLEPMAVQSKENFEHLKPFTWRFPEDPVEEVSRPPWPEEQRPPPLPADSVTVKCGKSEVRVEARRDLFGIHQPIQTADLTLGGCLATGENSSTVIFESELRGCDSTLTVTEDERIHIFTLHYNPTPLSSTPIVRTMEVAISVRCHYQREQDASSEAQKPTWAPFPGTKAGEEHPYFSLKLMADDWRPEKSNRKYFLAEMMNIEASVRCHVPLRVYVESCVATVTPNPDTLPKYTFIADHGCFTDAKYTGSSSGFVPRTQDDMLRFQMEAFKFINQNTDSIYITCLLKATRASAAIDAQNKACFFSSSHKTSRWMEASGRHETCGCCDVKPNCGSRRRDQLLGSDAQWEQMTSIGPINVKDARLS